MFCVFPGHPLAQPVLLCLLSSSILLPCHGGRHALWSYWLHWIFLGNWNLSVFLYLTQHFGISPYLYANSEVFDIFICILAVWFQAASPACTELETVMLDWLGKMLQLPECFIAGTHGRGGGVIQVTVICMCLLHVCFGQTLGWLPLSRSPTSFCIF